MDAPDAKSSTDKPHVVSVTPRWVKIAVSVTILVVVVSAWRAVYVSNQSELAIRRMYEKDQMTRGYLADTPSKRFSTVEGAVNAERMKKMAA